MGVMVGYLQGNSARAEASRKLSVAKYTIELAKTKASLESQGRRTKTNAEDTKAASRILSENDQLLARDHETISRIITNTWYAIENHIQVLRSVLRRLTSEQSSPQP